MTSTTSVQEQAAAVLREYFHQIDVDQRALSSGKPTDQRLRRVAKHLVPLTLRGRARVAVTRLLAPRERARAAACVQDRSPLLLHLGSGGEHKAGWVNVDLAGDPVEIAWDLARPLPFPDGSVDGIFHEHLLEHLPLADGLSFSRECFRVLKPGALLRVGVPDVARLIEQYVARDERLLATRAARPTGLLAVQEMFYWHRHCTMYDEETLVLLLHAAGFTEPRRMPPRDTGLPLVPDTERRLSNTVYVEALKPRG